MSSQSASARCPRSRRAGAVVVRVECRGGSGCLVAVGVDLPAALDSAVGMPSPSSSSSQKSGSPSPSVSTSRPPSSTSGTPSPSRVGRCPRRARRGPHQGVGDAVVVAVHVVGGVVGVGLLEASWRPSPSRSVLTVGVIAAAVGVGPRPGAWRSSDRRLRGSSRPPRRCRRLARISAGHPGRRGGRRCPSRSHRGSEA